MDELQRFALLSQLAYEKALGIPELNFSGVATPASEVAMAPQKKTPAPELPLVPSLRAANSKETLQSIREDLGDCQRCKLCSTRNHIVYGTGNPKAELMFVGEGPGQDEDLSGEPFVGRAGQLLTKIIEAMGLKRSDVYIANVVKCRPPNNRAPEPDEVAACIPFLFRQIATVKPKIVVVLGNVAMQNLLQTKTGITQLRGKFQDLQGVKVMPTFHPAFLLRNPPKKKEVWEDMQTVMKELGLKAPGKA